MEERVECALNTVTSLTRRFRENFEKKPISFDAYEEEILDKALPSEAESDKYEFFLNDNYQLYTTIFLIVILPTLLFLFYSAQIVGAISWFIFPILLLGGYLQYRVCKYVIIKLTHYNRQKNTNSIGRMSDRTVKPTWNL